MPSLFRKVVKNRRKKNKTRNVRSTPVVIDGIGSKQKQQQEQQQQQQESVDEQRLSYSHDSLYHDHHIDSTKEKNQPQQQGLLREWTYDDDDDERIHSTRSQFKKRSSSIDSISKPITALASPNRRHFFKPLRRKLSNRGSSTPETVASDCFTPSTSSDPRKQIYHSATTSGTRLYDGTTKPKAIKIDFEQELNLQARTVHSEIPFLSTNDQSKLQKVTPKEQQRVSVQKQNSGKITRKSALNKRHITKTVIMNGDIIVSNSGNSKSTSDTLTITSSTSSISKAKAIRRETERNARAAAALDDKGNELFEKGYFDKAMACYTKALKLKRRTFSHLIEDTDEMEEELVFRGKDGDKLTETQALVSMATSINNIGYLRQRSGDATPEETMAAYKKSLRIKRRILGNDSLSVGKTLNNIGSVHYLKRDLERALPAYDEALEIMKANLGEDHPDVATVMSNIGDVYLAQTNKEISLKYYRLALAIRWEAYGGKSPRVVRLLEKISNLEIGDGMISSNMSETNQNTDPVWGDDTASECMVGSGFQAIAEELKELQEQVRKDIEQVDQMERMAKVELLKDKIIIIRGMRDVWNGGCELLDNDSTSVMTAMSRFSNR